MTEEFLPNTLSRRDFLKTSTFSLFALAFGPARGFESSPQKGQEPFFQIDLPPGMGLIQIKKRDTLWSLAKTLDIDQNSLATLNGIENPRKQVITGDFLLVPSEVSDVKYADANNSTLRSTVVLRAVRDPKNFLPKDDYTDRELMLINRVARKVTSLAYDLFGPLTRAAGFYRVARAPIAQEGTIAYSNEGNKIVLRTGQSVSLSNRYTEGKFSFDTAEDLLWGMAQIRMSDITNIGPFNRANVVQAASTMADAVFPKEVSVINGYTISGSRYCMFEEYYLMREKPGVFSVLLTSIIDAKQRGIDLSGDEVMDRLYAYFPEYDAWKAVYDTSLDARRESTSTGKRFIWNSAMNGVNTKSVIGWWRPILSVRYPNQSESESGQFGVSKFVGDINYEPTRGEEGFLLRRSWELVGLSPYGENPPNGADESTLPFINRDPNLLFYLPDGSKITSPIKQKSEPYGSWV